MIKKRIVSAFLAITMIFGVGFASSSGAYAEGEGDPIEISTADDLYGAMYWGGNYVLTTDIDTGDSQYGGSLFVITSDATLDLGGHTINLASGASLYTYGADLTIKGSTGKIIQTTTSDYPAIYAYMGDVTLSGGTIQSQAYAVRVTGGNKITVDDGTITGEYGIIGHGASEVVVNGGNINTTSYSLSGQGLETGAKFTVSGGTLQSNEYAIYMPQIDGVLEISGGEITGAAGAVALNRGTATISGGVLKSLGTATLPGDAATDDGVRGYSNAVVGIAKEYDNVTLTVTGGEFIAEGNAGLIEDPSGLDTQYTATVSISGGKFSEMPLLTQVVDGYDVYDVSPTGPYYVEAATTVDLPEKLFLQVGETYTPTLSATASKYGTLGSSDNTIATVGTGNIVTANSIGSGVLNFNLHNHVNPYEANVGLTVFEVSQRTNDDAEDEADRTSLDTFWGNEVKAALASGRTSGFYRDGKAEVNIDSLLDAISRGVELESGLIINSVSTEDALDHTTGYDELMSALRDNEDAVAFFSAVVSLSSDNLLHSIGFGSKLDNPVTMRLAIPEEYKNKEGTLTVLRSHYDRASGEYKVDRMYSTRDGDELLVENDSFSTFAITYTPPASVVAPETGVITRVGGSATVASLITAIFVGITTSVLSFAYLMNRKNR